MSLKNHIGNFLKGEVPLVDVYYYIQGSTRYKLYYSKASFLIREHIKEQIAFRILVMNRECLNNGECVICGCQTTALQMCNKSCDGDCYPPMMSKLKWLYFQSEIALNFKGWIWKIEDGNLYKGRSEHSLVHISMIK